MNPKQCASVSRETKETSVSLSLDLSRPSPLISVQTGLPFFDHLLGSFAFHGWFSLSVKAEGDLDVDPHHLVEDSGIVLGRVLKKIQALTPVHRYGESAVPMDDALGRAVIDLAGRSFLVYQAEYPQDRAGNFDIFLLKEFFTALVSHGFFNLHLICPYGENSHHMAEALFKAFGRALKQALAPLSDPEDVLSTKGSL